MCGFPLPLREREKKKEAMNTDDDRYQRARRYVQALKGFYVHLIVYGIVNSGLFVLNL